MELNNFDNNDQSNIRFYDLENGNRLNLKRTDPYGFIYLSLERGALPEGMVGVAYTDWTQARLAAERYMSQRQTVIAELQDKAPKKGK